MATSCAARSSADGSKYSLPLPWIGLYVAAASLAHAVCLAVDLYYSFRRRKQWITSRFLSLNAATLTVLAVAAKIPSDITTEMPGVVDQLCKLSGTILVSITMNHVLPSLGSMDGLTVLSNVVALGILVATVSANVWIQIYTGVVAGFDNYNIIFSVSMVLMFVIFASYSLTVNRTKKILEEQYDFKHEQILKEVSRPRVDSNERFGTTAKLKDYLEKYWLMALTSSPDYTLLSSGMCLASAIICYGTIGVNFIQAVATQLGNSSSSGGGKGCYAGSDYKWSTAVIFSFQAFAILMGLVASLLRGLSSRPTTSFYRRGALLKIEKHWVQQLEEWKEKPLPFFRNGSRMTRKVTLNLKNIALYFAIKLQVGVIIIIKLCLIGNLWVAKWVFCLLFRLYRRCCARSSPTSPEGDEGSGTDADLSEYVLHLEGEDERNKAFKALKGFRKHPQRWIECGRKNQPTHLLDFITNLSIPVPEARAGLITGLCNDVGMELITNTDEIHQCCWSLQLVTLASIARAALDENHESVEHLWSSVSEGLRYVRFVEANLGDKKSKRMREATDMVWERADLYGKWLDTELDGLGPSDRQAMVDKLRDRAAEHEEKWGSGSTSSKWPAKAVAANCMRETCEAILCSGACKDGFALVGEILQSAIAGILRCCLADLPLAIFVQCSNGAFGEREDGVREAALVLGEAEEIIKFLEGSRVVLRSTFLG